MIVQYVSFLACAHLPRVSSATAAEGHPGGRNGVTISGQNAIGCLSRYFFVGGNAGIVPCRRIVLYRQALRTPKRPYAACLLAVICNRCCYICREVDPTEC